jgi:imidazolonepropionase-like amidohydrolase
MAGAPMDPKTREADRSLPAGEVIARGLMRLWKSAALGIAGVRDAGDARGVNLALRRLYLERAEDAPPTAYLDAAGAAVHRRGRYGAFYGTAFEEAGGSAACAEDRCARGADRLKLVVSDIIDFKKGAVTKPPQFSAAEVAELVAEGARRGLPTLAHASGAEGVDHAIEGGVATVEHGFFVTDDQISRMRDRAIAWTPTFAPVQVQIDRAAEMGWSPAVVDGLRRIIDGHAASLRLALKRGVAILAGSDAGSCGVPHALGLLTELELLERAGASPAAALAAATGRAAAALGLKEPLGRIAPGYRSRMILTRHDPLRTVAHLRRDRLVIFDGAVLAAPADAGPDGL